MSARWVGFAKEATYASAVATPTFYARYVDLDLQADQGRIIEWESLRREKEASWLGPFVGSGRVAMYARPDDIGIFLKGVMGAEQVTQIGTSGFYTHTFTVGDTIPSWTMWDVRPGVEARRMHGCLMKRVTVECPAREAVTVEAEIQYSWEDLVTAPSLGAVSARRPFIFHGGQVKWADTVIGEAESFRLTVENSIPDDVHGFDRKILEKILEGVEITAEMDMKFTSWDARRRFYGGTGSGSSPAVEEHTFLLEATFTGEPTGIGNPPNYKLYAYFPATVLREHETSVSRRERLTQRVTLQMLYHSGNKLELTNARSTEY